MHLGPSTSHGIDPKCEDLDTDHPHLRSIPSLSMQFRIIIYAAMGLIHASDWGLYSACIGCHAVGMLLGNQAGQIISQATFTLLLLGRFRSDGGVCRRGDARK